MIVIFVLSFMKNGDRNIFVCFIFAAVFGGTIKSELYSFSFLSISEWTILILFIAVHARVIIINKMIFLNITWIDKIFSIFLLGSIIIPLLSNFTDLYDLNIQFFKFFITIQVWMAYKIIYLILMENILKGRLDEKVNFILDCLLAFSAVSAVLGIASLAKFPLIADIINSIWDIHDRLRLSSTVGGINGSALFFAICAVISSFQMIKHNRLIYLIYFSVFSLSLVLSGSFSAAISFFFAFSILLIRYAKLIRVKMVLQLFALFAFFIPLVYSFSPVGNVAERVIERRIEQQFPEESESVVPSHLSSRYRRWVELFDYFIEKPFFGYGYNGIPEIGRIARVYSHSYYVFLLIYSGIFGLSAYIYMNLNILINLSKVRAHKSEAFLVAIIIYMYLISQITQLSFQYGALADLFGVLLALSAAMVKAERIGYPLRERALAGRYFTRGQGAARIHPVS